MTTLRFEQVTARSTKNLPCPSCGRKVRRSKTFTNTINPFNRNAEGQVKDYPEVRADVQAEAAAWQAQAECCSGCAGGAS